MSNKFGWLGEEPRTDLVKQIVTTLRREERKRDIFYLSLMTSLSVLSASGFLVALSYLYQAMLLSGFFRFVNLLFTDTAIVSSYISDFVYSLIESLPYPELMLSAFLAFVLFGSVTYLVQNRRDFEQVSFRLPKLSI